MTSDSVRKCVAPDAVLGEGPVWDSKSARLHWLDADQKKLFTFDPTTDAAQISDLPAYPGSYAMRKGGGLVMAYRNQIALIYDEIASAKIIETPKVDFSVERFNDGACDRRGRFWVGTMDRKLKEPVGSLFRLDPDLSLHKIETDLVCSNGIAFSPDDRVMYHTDTGAGKIYAYDYDIASGSVDNRRVFADFSGQAGRPDGCTIDAEGCLWVAQVGGGILVRIDPAGNRIREIVLPTLRPTSVMFGGAKLNTLYITTMKFGLTPEMLAQQPDAGGLLAIDLDVPGLSEPMFAG